MIAKHTVLVLGAGASKPYGFPSGQELRDSVILQDHEIWRHETTLSLGFSKDSYKAFIEDLSHSGFASVDAFLEESESSKGIGKAAIALQLLTAERRCKSKLFPPVQPKDHWYETLWRHLRASSWSSFKNNPVSIVTFNYDRSLEHYLATIASRNYGVSFATAMRGVERLPFLHVHGDLGANVSPEGAANFAEPLTQERYSAARKRIRIVHENKGQTRDFKHARKLIEEAERILFVGFGYNSKNMSKLGLSELKKTGELGPMRVLGTHKGFKSRAWGRVCHRYGFSHSALSEGAGSISEFIDEWLE
jgi:hypothetical protein